MFIYLDASDALGDIYRLRNGTAEECRSAEDRLKLNRAQSHLRALIDVGGGEGPDIDASLPNGESSFATQTPSPRHRIIYLRDFASISSVSLPFINVLLKAIRGRRAARLTPDQCKEPPSKESLNLQPTILILGIHGKPEPRSTDFDKLQQRKKHATSFADGKSTIVPSAYSNIPKERNFIGLEDAFWYAMTEQPLKIDKKSPELPSEVRYPTMSRVLACPEHETTLLGDREAESSRRSLCILNAARRYYELSNERLLTAAMTPLGGLMPTEFLAGVIALASKPPKKNAENQTDPAECDTPVPNADDAKESTTSAWAQTFRETILTSSQARNIAMLSFGTAFTSRGYNPDGVRVTLDEIVQAYEMTMRAPSVYDAWASQIPEPVEGAVDVESTPGDVDEEDPVIKRVKADSLTSHEEKLVSSIIDTGTKGFHCFLLFIRLIRFCSCLENDI